MARATAALTSAKFQSLRCHMEPSAYSTRLIKTFSPKRFSAFFEVLDDEEREAVRSIRLERWHGAPDAGRWMHQTTLNVPTTAKIAHSA